MPTALRLTLLLASLTLVGCAGGRELNTFGPPRAAADSTLTPLATDGDPCAIVVPRDDLPPGVMRDSLDVPPVLVGGLEGLAARLRYPELARRAGIEGGVCLQFVVDETGAVRDLEVVRSAHPLLDDEAARAVRASTFPPGLNDGEPVSVLFTLPVRYRLEGSDLVGTLIGATAVLGLVVLLAVLKGPPDE